MLLEQIGADAHIRQLFEPHAAQQLELGRVSFAAHEQYRIYLKDGDYEAVPAGRLRYDAVLPAVGDWVAARQVDPKLALLKLYCRGGPSSLAASPAEQLPSR